MKLALSRQTVLQPVKRGELELVKAVKVSVAENQIHRVDLSIVACPPCPRGGNCCRRSSTDERHSVLFHSSSG